MLMSAAITAFAESTTLSSNSTSSPVTLGNEPVTEAMIISDNSMPFEDISSDCVFGESKLYCHSWGFKNYLQTTVREYGDSVLSCVTIRERKSKCFWELGFEDEDTDDGKCCDIDAVDSSVKQLASTISNSTTVSINTSGETDSSSTNSTSASSDNSPVSTKACTCFPSPPVVDKWADGNNTVIVGTVGAAHSCLRLWTTGQDADEVATASSTHTGDNVTNATALAEQKAEEEEEERLQKLKDKGIDELEEYENYVDSEGEEYDTDLPDNMKEVTNADGVTMTVTMPTKLSSTDGWTMCKPKSRKQQWVFYAPSGIPKSNVDSNKGIQGKVDLSVNVILRNHATKMCLRGIADDSSSTNATNSTSSTSSSSSSSEDQLNAVLADMADENDAIDEGTTSTASVTKKTWTGLGVQRCLVEPITTEYTFTLELIRRGPYRGFSRIKKAYSTDNICLTITDGGSLELASCSDDPSDVSLLNANQLFYLTSRVIRQSKDDGLLEKQKREDTLASAAESGTTLTANSESEFVNDNKNWENNSFGQAATLAVGLGIIVPMLRL